VHDSTRTEICWFSHEIYDIKCNIEFPCDAPGFETKSFFVGLVIQLKFATVLPWYHFRSFIYVYLTNGPYFICKLSLVTSVRQSAARV